jgi:hypothetical protein
MLPKTAKMLMFNFSWGFSQSESENSIDFISSYMFCHFAVVGGRFMLRHRHHRVYRVQGFFSSRPNWDFPTPSHAGECVPSSFDSGGDTLMYGRGGEGGPNFDEGTDTVLL